MDLPPGQLVDEPGLHGAEEQFSPLGPFAGAGDMIQYPLELGGREIGVDDEAGLCLLYTSDAADEL